MKFNLSYKKYLVMGMRTFPSEMVVLEDFDSLADALVRADRNKGEFVLEIPRGAETEAGNIMEVDTSKKIAQKVDLVK